ncbi:MAG: MoaD/ThiS family protein [Candidatus Lokiarchaeota archaeon]|nr:MoaD/ThiS family protein [Candidatus Lokiarchaeota archaeon]
MFDVKITFLSLLTDITNVEELNLPIEEGVNIRAILEQLTKKFGSKFEEMIFKSSKDLSKYVIITVNSKDIRMLDGLSTKIQLNDEISFIPAIAGG